MCKHFRWLGISGLILLSAVLSGCGGTGSAPAVDSTLARPAAQTPVSSSGTRDDFASKGKTLNWPELGFDAGHSGYNLHETILSASNVSDLQHTWSTSASGAIQGVDAMVEDGGLIFVESGGSGSYDVTAVKASDGTPVWTSQPLDLNGAYPMGIAAGSGLVFVGCNVSGQGMCAFKQSNGRLAWFHGVSSFQVPPAYANGLVFFNMSTNCENCVSEVALNAKTGAVVWADGGWDAAAGVAAIANGTVYFTCGPVNGTVNLCAFNASSGASQWEWTPPASMNVSSSVAVSVANGVAYLVLNLNSSPSGYSYQQALVAINAKTGATIWTFYEPGNGVNGNWGNALPAAATKSSVYWVGGDTAMYALNAKTGTQLWANVDAPCYFQTSPSIANGVVYAIPTVGCNQSEALGASTGAELWLAPGSDGTAPNGSVSPPIILNGTLYAQCWALCAYNLPTPRRHR
ncbi:MAG: PQQ-binding-like beta-propeller repeat protein [Candidatus Eremiobacteraeota bacterium]|nr:PQQ-binding-like beta-propeller repeat protein [Candidatus Eremiobacteraeota bacterium]